MEERFEVNEKIWDNIQACGYALATHGICSGNSALCFGAAFAVTASVFAKDKYRAVGESQNGMKENIVAGVIAGLLPTCLPAVVPMIYPAVMKEFATDVSSKIAPWVAGGVLGVKMLGDYCKVKLKHMTIEDWVNAAGDKTNED